MNVESVCVTDFVLVSVVVLGLRLTIYEETFYRLVIHLRGLLSSMENVLFLSDVLFEKWKLWLSVLIVRRKSVNQRRLGRWLGRKTKVERERNSQLVFLSAVESLSGQF